MVGYVQVLRHWLVACCHGKGLLQLPIWSELHHSGDLGNKKKLKK